MVTRCQNCNAEIPQNSQFCPTCGQPVPQPATGVTQQLREQEQGTRCVHCDAMNPPGARFCATCGTPLHAATSPTYAPTGTPVPALHPVNLIKATPSVPMQQARGNKSRLGLPLAVPSALFLLGLALLAWTGWWWPGILVLVGITTLLSSITANKPRESVLSGFWLLGLAVIAQFNWWWPGMLVLAAIAVLGGAMLNTAKRSTRT